MKSRLPKMGKTVRTLRWRGGNQLFLDLFVLRFLFSFYMGYQGGFGFRSLELRGEDGL